MSSLARPAKTPSSRSRQPMMSNLMILLCSGGYHTGDCPASCSSKVGSVYLMGRMRVLSTMRRRNGLSYQMTPFHASLSETVVHSAHDSRGELQEQEPTSDRTLIVATVRVHALKLSPPHRPLHFESLAALLQHTPSDFLHHGRARWYPRTVSASQYSDSEDQALTLLNRRQHTCYGSGASQGKSARYGGRH